MYKNISNKSIVSNIVFLLTIIVVGVSLVSVVFPVLIITITSPYENELSPFEPSPRSFLLIISNAILIGIGFLYYSNKLPESASKYFEFISNFELSRNVTIIVISVILFIYVIFTLPELFIDEAEQWPDYRLLEFSLEIWPFEESEKEIFTELNTRYVKMLLVSISQNIFQNIKILPFVASIALVIVTYFFTFQISKKRFAGIISMLVLLQGYTFLKYDTSAIYDNFWVLFYVLSVYFIYKKWYLSSIFYVFAFFSKVLIIPFFVINVFLLYQTHIKKKKKILILLSYLLAIIFILMFIFSGESTYGNQININFSDFWNGFTLWANQMRFDYFITMTILPVVIALYFISRKGFVEADLILFLIFGSLLSAPLLYMITDLFVFFPYHFITLIVFFSIGVGVLLSKRIT